jgi:hypothetical protein
MGRDGPGNGHTGRDGLHEVELHHHNQEASAAAHPRIYVFGQAGGSRHEGHGSRCTGTASGSCGRTTRKKRREEKRDPPPPNDQEAAPAVPDVYLAGLALRGSPVASGPGDPLPCKGMYYYYLLQLVPPPRGGSAPGENQ